MPRKFSIDIPKLMVSRKPTKDQTTSSCPESPPPPAKSVRPALPEDVEAALRSICTKIFNETNATSLPDTDHDLLRAFWQQDSEEVQYDAGAQKVQTVQLSQHIVQQVSAGAVLPKRQDNLRDRAQSPRRAQGHLTASLPKSIQRSRPAAPRGDSIDTLQSISQSDLTDEASTAMTSAFITPVDGSKRGSSQAAASCEDDSRRYYTTKRDSKHSAQDKSPEVAARQEVTEQSTPMSRTRGFIHGLIRSKTDDRPATATSTRRGRAATNESVSDDRTGRTTFRSRAASSARSLSRGVKEYLRPSSRRGPGDAVTIDQQNAYDAAAALEASRPDTSSGMRKASMEFFRRGRRSSREREHEADDQKASSAHYRNLNATNTSYRSAAPVEGKQALDLNRALPPLPALDLWQDSPVLLIDEPTEQAVELEAAFDLPHTPTSPFPVMSATAFPGDFDMYAPMGTPSSISKSSIRDLQLRSRAGSIALSYLSDAELESPKFAMLIGNKSVPDLKPHIITTRRPSNPSRPENLQTAEDDELPALPQGLEVHQRGELAGRASMDDSIGARPVVMLRKKTRKSWWKGGKPKKHDWMRDVEHSGSKSGMLVLNESITSPVVKYSS